MSESKRAGIDRRNESEERYGSLPTEGPMRPRHGEREVEAQEHAAGTAHPERATEVRRHDEAKGGYGAPVEGAFGVEGRVESGRPISPQSPAAQPKGRG